MLSQVDKSKILGYFNTHRINNMYKDEFKSHLKCKDDKEILKFFIDYLNQCFQKDKISVKLIEKILNASFTFLDDLIQDEIKIETSFLIQIKRLEEEYEKFIERTNTEEETIIKSSILRLVNYTNKLTKDISEKEFTFLNEIETLKQKINRLEAEIKEKNNILETIEANIEAKDEKINHRDMKIKILKKDIADKIEEINKLKEAIKGYLAQIENLNNEINEQRVRNEELDKYSREQLAIKEHELTLIKEEKAKIKKEITTNELIKEIIIKSLYQESRTATELLAILSEKGIDLNEYNLLQSLIKLKETINIEKSNIYLGEPLYSIEKPSIKTDGTYKIILPESQNTLDLFFSADVHIDAITDEIKKNYDAIIEYCINNNIKQTINLGDFLDFSTRGYKLAYTNFKEKEEIINALIQILPVAPGIYHSILGGNHEEANLYLGKDYLEYFVMNRSDYISLGYRNCALEIGSKEEIYAKLLLAHPNENLNRNHLENKINILTEKIGIERDEYYFSFLGHSHLSLIDTINRVCAVSSLTRDHFYNGALHVKLFFGDNKVDHMVFKPLVLNRKLTPVSEIVYRK